VFARVSTFGVRLFCCPLGLNHSNGERTTNLHLPPPPPSPYPPNTLLPAASYTSSSSFSSPPLHLSSPSSFLILNSASTCYPLVLPFSSPPPRPPSSKPSQPPPGVWRSPPALSFRPDSRYIAPLPGPRPTSSHRPRSEASVLSYTFAARERPAAACFACLARLLYSWQTILTSPVCTSFCHQLGKHLHCSRYDFGHRLSNATTTTRTHAPDCDQPLNRPTRRVDQSNTHSTPSHSSIDISNIVCHPRTTRRARTCNPCTRSCPTSAASP
jgi:hypothetical protein